MITIPMLVMVCDDASQYWCWWWLMMMHHNTDVGDGLWWCITILMLVVAYDDASQYWCWWWLMMMHHNTDVGNGLRWCVTLPNLVTDILQYLCPVFQIAAGIPQSGAGRTTERHTSCWCCAPAFLSPVVAHPLVPANQAALGVLWAMGTDNDNAWTFSQQIRLKKIKVLYNELLNTKQGNKDRILQYNPQQSQSHIYVGGVGEWGRKREGGGGRKECHLHNILIHTPSVTVMGMSIIKQNNYFIIFYSFLKIWNKNEC